MKEINLHGQTRSSFSIGTSIDRLIAKKHPSIRKYNVMFVSFYNCIKEENFHRQTKSSFSVVQNVDILITRKYPSLEKYHATTTIQKILIHKLFDPTKDLEAVVSIYKNRSNYTSCLLYYFVSHFNRIKELDL